MESRSSDSEVTCGIPPTLQCSQRLIVDVTDHFKQEEDCPVQNPQCFSEVRKDCCGNDNPLLTKIQSKEAQERFASVSYSQQPTSNREDDKDAFSTELLKPLKNEDDQHGSDLLSGFSGSPRIMSTNVMKQEQECKVEVEDHVLYKFMSPFMPLREQAQGVPTERKERLSVFPVSGSVTPPLVIKQDVEERKVDIEGHLAYGFEAVFGKQEAYDEHVADGLQAGTLKDTCNVELGPGQTSSEHNPPVEPSEGFRYNCSGERHKSRSANMKTPSPFVGKTHKCLRCDHTNNSPIPLNVHENTKHNPDAAVYQCVSCSYSTKRKRKLSAHFNIHHNPEIYKCTLCDYAFKYKDLLTRHFKSRHGKVYKCVDCDYTTKSTRYLKAHVKQNHSQLYRCDKCSYSTRLKCYLTQHLEVWHSVITYKCADCDFTTSCRKYLNIHVKKKHGADRFSYATRLEHHVCPDCGYAVGSRRLLKRHLEVEHDAEAKLYKCTFCDVTSNDWECINRHVQTHDELYKCSRCDFLTAHKNILVNHFRLRHGPSDEVYKCSCCDFVTAHKNGLVNHFRFTHDPGEEVYKHVAIVQPSTSTG